MPRPPLLPLPLPLLLLLLLLLPFTTPSTTLSSSLLNGNPRLLTDVVGVVNYVYNATSDTTDIHLPAQVRPWTGAQGDHLSEWAAWAQRLYEAQVTASGREQLQREPSLFAATPALPTSRVRFVREPDPAWRWSSSRAEQTTQGNQPGWRLAPEDYSRVTYSPVFEVEKGDFVSVWKTLTDRKYDRTDEFFYVRVLAWNIYLMDAIFPIGQKTRAPLFGKYAERLGKFDAVCLSECFEAEPCDVALKSFHDVGYVHQTASVNRGSSGLLIQPAGVRIVSPHEIIEEHHLEYSGHWSRRRAKTRLNYFVRRGAVVARMRTSEGYVFSMACTHPDFSKHMKGDGVEQTEASIKGDDLDELAREQRQMQLRELRHYIDRVLKISDTEPLIMAGDFNVDKRYYGMLSDNMRLDSMDAQSNGAVRDTVPLSKRMVEQSYAYASGESLTPEEKEELALVRSTFLGTPHLRQTIVSLEAMSPNSYGGAKMTLDPSKNKLVMTSKAKYLDYIFVDGQHRVAAEPFVQWCIPIHVDEEDAYDRPTIFAGLKAGWRWVKNLGKKDKDKDKPEQADDLSDHYPVVASLRFRKVDINPPLAKDSDSKLAPFVDPATLPLSSSDLLFTIDRFAMAGTAADTLFLFPAAVSRAQNTMITGNIQPVSTLHADYRPAGVWRHFWRWDEKTGKFHWRPRDNLALFADITRPPVVPDWVKFDLRVGILNVIMPGGVQKVATPFLASQERAARLPKYIDRLGGGEPLDAFCFAECFDDKLCADGVLGRTLRGYGYKYNSGTTGVDMHAGTVQDAGVFIATPHKILERDTLPFEHSARGFAECASSPSNCFTQRGAVRVKLEHRITKRVFHVVCAAFEYATKVLDETGIGAIVVDKEAADRRLKQLTELDRWLGPIDTSVEPVVLLADTNMEAASIRSMSKLGTPDEESQRFREAMKREWLLSHDDIAGESFTGDVFENEMLAQLYPGQKPSLANLISVRRMRTKVGLRVVPACDATKALWIPYFKADKSDAYNAPNLRNWFKNLGKDFLNSMSKLFGFKKRFKKRKWRDLAINYPLLAHVAIFKYGKVRENQAYLGKHHPEGLADFDPAVVGADSLGLNSFYKRTEPPTDADFRHFASLKTRAKLKRLNNEAIAPTVATEGKVDPDAAPPVDDEDAKSEDAKSPVQLSQKTML